MEKRNRQSHAGKSKLERQQYARGIQEIASDQTSDERLPFENSDNIEEFTAERRGLQKESPAYKLIKFISDNIVGVIVTVIGTVVSTVIIILAFTLNRESGIHEESIKSIRTDVGRIESAVNIQVKETTEMKLQINDVKKDVEYINKEIEEMKNKK